MEKLMRFSKALVSISCRQRCVLATSVHTSINTVRQRYLNSWIVSIVSRHLQYQKDEAYCDNSWFCEEMSCQLWDGLSWHLGQTSMVPWRWMVIALVIPDLHLVPPVCQSYHLSGGVVTFSCSSNRGFLSLRDDVFGECSLETPLLNNKDANKTYEAHGSQRYFTNYQLNQSKVTVPMKWASEKKKEGSQATPLISFPLITSQHRSESWFEWFHWWREPKALKHQSDRPPLRQPAKVMPYHIWHPKAWEIDPPVWPLIGLGFEHKLGQRIEGRVKSKMYAWLRSFVMGIDELPPWGRLEQSGHAEHSMS